AASRRGGGKGARRPAGHAGGAVVGARVLLRPGRATRARPMNDRPSQTVPTSGQSAEPSRLGPNEAAVLDALRRYAGQWLSVDEACYASGVKRRAVRHHLGRFAELGVVETQYRRGLGPLYRVVV